MDDQVYPSKVKPTWQDMAEMGEAAFEQGWLDTTIKWLEEAKMAATDVEGHTTGDMDRSETTKSSLPERIAQVKRVHDETLDKRGPVSHRHRCNQLPFDSKMAKKKKYRKARKEGKKGSSTKKIYELVPLFSTVDNHNRLHDNFQLMCHNNNNNNNSNNNGSNSNSIEELMRPPQLDWPLRCYWHHLGDPHQRLGPLKLEEKGREPFVAVLHGFLSEPEMAHLKKYAGERLFRSRTGFTDSMHTTLTRTSKQTWLADKYFSGLPAVMPGYDPESFEPPPLPFGYEKYLEVLDRPSFELSLRLEAATGLRLLGPLSAESYQVANYGLGGQYSSHHDSNGFFEGRVDAARQPEHYRHCRGVGDRFVTIMGYLTDVAYGGDTVFPLTGVRSPVERGAVLLWVNLLSDGSRDEWTYHGGCPVAVGSKWITNKWVFYNDQFKGWPCHLKKGQRHDTLKVWRSRSGIAPPKTF